MQTRKIFLLLLIIFSIGCSRYAYFKTPNDLLNKECTVYFTDGTIKTGQLSIQFETGRKGENLISFENEKNQVEKISIENIKYYEFEREFYFPKIINLNTYEIPVKDNLYLENVRNILFVKRLTGENAKIHFYERYQSRVGSLDGNEQHDYFISFSNDGRFTAWDIRSNKFFPKFEEKVSNLVSDCRSFSNKIIQQANGYYLTRTSLDVKKYETFKRIVEEYNTCN